MQVIIDTLLTSYAHIGSGSKTVLFLHGWADSGKTFNTLAQQLIKENPDYQVVALDLPGFGATQTPQASWNLPDYATFVAHFMAKTKYRPEVIIGHSNGGAIAIHGISQNIFTTQKLVLIGSAGIRNKSAKKEMLRMLAKPAKVAIKVAPAATQKRVKQKLYSTIGSDYLVAEHMQETFKNIVAYDVRNEAAQITLPTCIIYGEHDTATPPEYGTQFNTIIPTSTLHIVPLATHFVHQEQVPKVATIIKEFIS